ncbi:MAG: AbrB/MazE/SpoVT family DNA-binding domain-containing protein [Gammaproteobacteria bacterium]
MGQENRMANNARFETTIQPWGNSLGLRITKSISDLAQIGKGAKVTVEVTNNGLVVKKKVVKKSFRIPYSEAELLKGMTPRKAHADELLSLLTTELGE